MVLCRRQAVGEGTQVNGQVREVELDEGLPKTEIAARSAAKSPTSNLRRALGAAE